MHEVKHQYGPLCSSSSTYARIAKCKWLPNVNEFEIAALCKDVSQASGGPLVDLELISVILVGGGSSRIG